MATFEIKAEDWDKVPIPERSAYLRSKGVPIDEMGRWKQPFCGIEMRKKENKVTWVYYWNGD